MLLQTLHLQAVVSAISNWITALEPATAGPVPKGPKLDPMVMLPGLAALHDLAVLDTLTCTIIAYLENQARWHEFRQHGLQSFLRHLCASMHKAVRLFKEQGVAGHIPMHHGFEALSTASGSPAPLHCSNWRVMSPCLTRFSRSVGSILTDAVNDMNQQMPCEQGPCQGKPCRQEPCSRGTAWKLSLLLPLLS